jgi:ElaB/YqjD/DUF883 family membrane-anchored ribosome-binding protein
MGESTAQLRNDIERTREDMSRDLDAIGDRISPRRMAERRVGRSRRWLADAKERVFGSADEMAHTTGDRMHTAQDRMHETGERVTEQAHRVGEAVRETPQRAKRQTQGNPMVAGGVAFGLGFLAAMVFGATEKEQELLHRAEDRMGDLEPVKEELTEAAREVAGTASSAAGQAAEELKESASERAHEVADTAKQDAKQVKDEAQRAKDRPAAQTSGVTPTTNPDLPPPGPAI